HASVGVNHGKKRPAENDPESDQPLAKRFRQLHINSKPIGSSYNDKESLPTAEMMLLDDTKHTIYIHDLDRELADTEPTDFTIEILPSIIDNMSSIPQLLMTKPAVQNNELVLYTEPASLSIPRERDNVRKALIATRERAARRCQHMY
ncbi:hypothetical protein BO71DRAFT_310187, partial [Aspergillus ellipticus CBS 707.79]